MVFKRRRDDPSEQSVYATTSQVAPGPFAEYPTREPDAVIRHAEVYNAQRDRLNAMLTKSGQSGGVFVAKVFAVERPDGGAHTYTTWTQGINTLLPAADVVLLVEQPESAEVKPPMTRVRWDVVASVCADTCWVAMTDFHPVRLQTRSWPTPDQLTELKARQLPEHR